MPTTGAPTISSPSCDGEVGGTPAVIGADITGTEETAATDDTADADGASASATAEGAGVAVETATGGGVGVAGIALSRARGAVDMRPMDAPHVAQKRCPGGFDALHAGQIAGTSLVSDLVNLNDGASGRERTEPGLPEEPGSPEADDGAIVGDLLGLGSGFGSAGGVEDASMSSETLSSDANNAAESIGPKSPGSPASTRFMPAGGVGGTPRL